MPDLKMNRQHCVEVCEGLLQHPGWDWSNPQVEYDDEKGKSREFVPQGQTINLEFSSRRLKEDIRPKLPELLQLGTLS